MVVQVRGKIMVQNYEKTVRVRDPRVRPAIEPFSSSSLPTSPPPLSPHHFPRPYPLLDSGRQSSRFSTRDWASKCKRQIEPFPPRHLSPSRLDLFLDSVLSPFRLQFDNSPTAASAYELVLAQSQKNDWSGPQSHCSSPNSKGKIYLNPINKKPRKKRKKKAPKNLRRLLQNSIRQAHTVILVWAAGCCGPKDSKRTLDYETTNSFDLSLPYISTISTS